MEWAKSTKIKSALILILFLLLYSYRLDLTPVHLNQDELEFSLNAYSIAVAGRSQTGMLFPVYFPHLGLFWSTLFVVYLPSFFILFLPFSEITVRLSSVTMAIVSALLIYLLAKRLYVNKRSALAAIFIMLTSPAMFINSRVLLDNIYTIPFVLAWLLFFKIYLDNHNTKNLILSALSLGIGIHSYHAAKIIMPLYASMTIIYLLSFHEKQKVKSSFLFLLVFILPFLIFIPWFTRFPESLMHQVKYISGFDSSINASQGLLGVFNFQRFWSIANSYLAHLSPGIIFFHGDISLIHSTGNIGVFSFFIIPLFLLGIISILRSRRNKFAKFLLFVFLTYPIAPAIVNEPQRISRGLVAIPLLSIIAAYGFDHLMIQKNKFGKHLAQLLILLIGIHFTIFLQDYFGNYRIRSQAWFNYNIPGTMESLIELENNNQMVYLDEMTGFVDRYYKFFQIKKRSRNQNVKLFNYKYPPVFEGNSLILVRYDHMISTGQIVKTIYEPNGLISFYILQSE